MAIDWQTGTSALFKKLGKIARIVEIYDAFETDIDGDLNGLVTTTWTEDVDYYSQAISSILTLKDNMKNQLSAMREEIASTAINVLQGEMTSGDGAPVLTQVDMMNRLVQRMFESNVGVSQAGPQAIINLSDAYGYRVYLFADKSLFSSDATYSARDREYANVRVPAFYAEAVDVSKRYSEKIAVYTPSYGYTRPGGQDWGKQFPRTVYEVVNASSSKNRVRNGSFENSEIDNLTPKDWILNGGDWGSDAYVIQTDSYLNARSLSIDTPDTVVLKQLISDSVLKPRTVYVACIRAKDLDGSSNWDVKLDLKTPYQTINVITTGQVSSSWDLYYGYFITPDVITGAEWQLYCLETGAPGPVAVDELVVVEASYFAGIPLIAVTATDGLPVQGLKISESSVTDTGKFASFFGRFFNAHLPNHSGGTAINDSLVA